MNRTFCYLHTDTTTNAQFFRYLGVFGIGLHFDAKLPHLHYRATALAFLSAFLWFTPVGVHDRNTSELVVGHGPLVERDSTLHWRESCFLLLLACAQSL